MRLKELFFCLAVRLSSAHVNRLPLLLDILIYPNELWFEGAVSSVFPLAYRSLL